MSLLQELKCLQENYEELEEECSEAVKEFTEEEDKDAYMDRQLMKACSGMVKTFCKVRHEQANTYGPWLRRLSVASQQMLFDFIDAESLACV